MRVASPRQEPVNQGHLEEWVGSVSDGNTKEIYSHRCSRTSELFSFDLGSHFSVSHQELLPDRVFPTGFFCTKLSATQLKQIVILRGCAEEETSSRLKTCYHKSYMSI